jgi:hypothetical protein
MKPLKLFIAALLIAPPTTAQTAIERIVELPAHARLETIRKDVNNTLSPFETDGCSGYQSQTWEFIAAQIPSFETAHGNTPPWENCCVAHDRVYHIAGFDRGPSASFDARLKADEKLYACVTQTASDRDTELSQTYGMTSQQVKTAYTAIANAMFYAVRLGGAPCSGLPWRWGYGYKNCGLFD